MLSISWEAAGGTSIRYDERRGAEQDCLTDQELGKKRLDKPKDAYHFAFPCHHMSVAHTTPKVRSLDNPYGNESDEEISYYNKMAMVMAQRIIVLASKGAMILVENPLLSYLYMLNELLGVMGCPGVTVFRENDCTAVGSPWM